MIQELTPEICRAAAWDAGNRNMRQAGRRQWNEDDYNAASDEYLRLLGEKSCVGTYTNLVKASVAGSSAHRAPCQQTTSS